MGNMFGGGGNSAQQMQQQNQQMLAQQNAQFAQQQAQQQQQQQQQAQDQMLAGFKAFQNQQMANKGNQSLINTDPQMAWRNILSSASTPTEQAWAAGQLWHYMNQPPSPTGNPGNPLTMGGGSQTPAGSPFIPPPLLLAGKHP